MFLWYFSLLKLVCHVRLGSAYSSSFAILVLHRISLDKSQCYCQSATSFLEQIKSQVRLLSRRQQSVDLIDDVLSPFSVAFFSPQTQTNWKKKNWAFSRDTNTKGQSRSRGLKPYPWPKPKWTYDTALSHTTHRLPIVAGRDLSSLTYSRGSWVPEWLCFQLNI